MPTPFLQLLQRASKGIHPELLADDIPKHKFKWTDRFNADSYDGLTDESPYSDYAWAFLRRNRFYQLSCDDKINHYDIETWGYKPNSESPATCGLMFKKPYIESHIKAKDSVTIMWEGVHSFVERHTKIHPSQPGCSKKIDFPRSEFRMVFDIDPILGVSSSAIEIQIKLAQEILKKRAKDSGFTPTTRAQKPDKKDLRSWLRVADLLSPERKSEQNAAGGENQLQWEINIDEKRPRMEAVGIKLLPCDLGNAKTNQQTAKKASALADKAFNVIYKWRFLNWLQFDDWRLDRVLCDFEGDKPAVP